MNGFDAIRDDRGTTYVQPLPAPRCVAYYPEPATHVCIWFNRTTRDWVVSLSDERGQQVGNSTYVGDRQWALDEAADLLIGGTL